MSGTTVRMLPSTGAERNVESDDEDWLENASPLTEGQISMLTRTIALDAQGERARAAAETDAALEREAFEATRFEAPPVAGSVVGRSRPAAPARAPAAFSSADLDLSNLASAAPGDLFPIAKTPAAAPSIEDEFEAFLNQAKANMLARSSVSPQ